MTSIIMGVVRTKWAILQEKLFKHYMNTSYYCCGANNFPPELQQCPPLWFPNKRGNLHMVGVHFLFVNILITSSQLCPGAAEVSLDFLLWDSMKFNFSTAPFLFPFPPLQNFQVAWARELVCKPWGQARKRRRAPGVIPGPPPLSCGPGTLQGCSQTLLDPSHPPTSLLSPCTTAHNRVDRSRAIGAGGSRKWTTLQETL